MKPEAPSSGHCSRHVQQNQPLPGLCPLPGAGDRRCPVNCHFPRALTLEGVTLGKKEALKSSVFTEDRRAWLRTAAVQGQPGPRVLQGPGPAQVARAAQGPPGSQRSQRTRCLPLLDAHPPFPLFSLGQTHELWWNLQEVYGKCELWGKKWHALKIFVHLNKFIFQFYVVQTCGILSA